MSCRKNSKKVLFHKKVSKDTLFFYNKLLFLRTFGNIRAFKPIYAFIS